jgi:thiosulfate/3-mercaptopyruvate sulfurtransferase
VVLYGSQESSGEAEFAFFTLRYLGQNEVKLLDGSLSDWKAAGLPEEVGEVNKTAVEYTPQVRSDVMAEYDYVKSGQAQIIDVRPFVDFGKGRIPGSIALDPTNVIKGDKIKNGGDLTGVFSRLDKEKPVVVYSDDYSRSALAAYALQLMGYQASMYSWEDWKAHEATEVQAGTAPAGEDAVGSNYVKLGRT